MAEPVRLIIWDLDDSFWRGTLTEGGVTYVQTHHDIVITLAKRGILSSICSKNAYQDVQRILGERGLWDFFIFPSIDWQPKGPRLAALVEAVQLRPASILFIDDNALNRNEARHFVPDLQIADETIIPGLLENPLCRGKEDAGLTRLAQYKLLEARHVARDVAGDNLEFLRASNIRVTVEHDLEPHRDRVIELINRTNQLNFTKTGLPEDRAGANKVLDWLLNDFLVHGGLVRVQDDYGDYGFVGIYFVRIYQQVSTLLHFCFSCRVLGMGVERWVYDRLGRPQLNVVGEVLTDLFTPGLAVDWINADTVTADAAKERLAGRILVRGGCDMSGAAHYLTLNADEVVGEFNLKRNDLSVRLDHSLFLKQAVDGLSAAALQIARGLGYTESDFVSALAEAPRSFDACLFGFLNDARMATYHHPRTGLQVPFFEAPGPEHANLLLAAGHHEQHIAKAIQAYRAQGLVYCPPSAESFRQNLLSILAVLPETTVVFMILNPETWPAKDGRPERAMTDFHAFNQVILEVGAERRNTHVFSMLEFVKDPSDRIDHIHYGRLVFFRLYQKIGKTLRQAETQRLSADLLATAD